VPLIVFAELHMQTREVSFK